MSSSDSACWPFDSTLLKIMTSDFIVRYFDKNTVQILVREFGDGLASHTSRKDALTPETKILITLRYLASNSLQQVVGDCFGVNLSTACRAIWQVIPNIVAQMDKFIFFPSGRELEKTQTDFKHLTGIPGIVGALDCTHVIVPVGKEREFAFIDRKGPTSLNTQAV